MLRPLLLLTIAATIVGCGKAPPPPVADAPASADVREVLTRYFKVWSDKDIAAYGKLFDPGATIMFVADGVAHPWQLAPFLESQRHAHATATSPLVETAERMDIHLSPDGRVAQAAVKWRLVDAGKVTLGWDYFTLIRSGNDWKILHLVYYAE